MEQITWQDYERLVKDIYETLGVCPRNNVLNDIRH